MSTQVEATFANGVLKPDVLLPLAEHARVRLTIEPVSERQSASEAWIAFRDWIRNNPLHLGGKRFTRDELYDRR
jgi:hypothetical protein